MSKSVLVVDDDPDIAELIVEELVDLGMTVKTAGNGAEALTMVGQHTFDFILTDLEMPVMNGLELIKRVRLNYPTIPIAVISGKATHFATECMYLMVDGALAKPFNTDELSRLAHHLRELSDAKVSFDPVQIPSMTAAEIMNPDVLVVTSRASVREVSRTMWERNVGSAVVVDDEEVQGIVTERDVLRCVAEGQCDDSVQQPVSAIMTKSVTFAKPDASVKDLLQTMQKEGIRHLPVMTDNSLQGILSIKDLLSQRNRLVNEAFDEQVDRFQAVTKRDRIKWNRVT